MAAWRRLRPVRTKHMAGRIQAIDPDVLKRSAPMHRFQPVVAVAAWNEKTEVKIRGSPISPRRIGRLRRCARLGVQPVGGHQPGAAALQQPRSSPRIRQRSGPAAFRPLHVRPPVRRGWRSRHASSSAGRCRQHRPCPRRAGVVAVVAEDIGDTIKSGQLSAHRRDCHVTIAVISEFPVWATAGMNASCEIHPAPTTA